MAEFREDLDIYPLMVELSACLCTELADSGLPPVCRCGLMPGTSPTLDFSGDVTCANGGCGQAWVRLVNAFPSDDFPNPAVGIAQRCDIALAYELEVGISRCEDVGRTVGNKYTPPTLAAQVNSVRQYTADMAAMRRAILCCFRGAHDERDDLEIALGLYQPLDSSGGVGGGIWNVTVRRI